MTVFAFIIKSIHLFRTKQNPVVSPDCFISPTSASPLDIHCTLCLRCCQNKVPPSELCQWLMCNNCSLSTDYTINISVDISGVWSIINSSTSTLRRIYTSKESVWSKVCETVIISPPLSVLSSARLIISILSTNTSEDDAARTQRAASGLEMANTDSHVSRVPVTCGDSNIYGHGNLISQIYICPDQFYIKWMQGSSPPADI